MSEEQQRQRVRELVQKKTGLDWPTLKVGDIEKAMSSVTLFYWCKKEDVGKRWLQKQLDLSDEEAESIGVLIGLCAAPIETRTGSNVITSSVATIQEAA